MTQNTITKDELSQFIGSENWYPHSIARNVPYTDGIKYLAEMAGAYWLVDEIALAQRLPGIQAKPLQSWRLQVHPNHTGLLTCDDGNFNICLTKKIEFTDFPLDGIAIYYPECDHADQRILSWPASPAHGFHGQGNSKSVKCSARPPVTPRLSPLQARPSNGSQTHISPAWQGRPMPPQSTRNSVPQDPAVSVMPPISPNFPRSVRASEIAALPAQTIKFTPKDKCTRPNHCLFRHLS